MDPAECLRRGAIGAVGAVPGTLAAHPFDVLKIRTQTATMRTFQPNPRTLYAGVGAGVLQKVATRGPMFLASETCTRAVQRGTGANRDAALWIGSAGSGYITGFAAASFEWAKVQRSVGGAGLGGAARGRRARICSDAGLRNALFDATRRGRAASWGHGGAADAGRLRPRRSKAWTVHDRAVQGDDRPRPRIVAAIAARAAALRPITARRRFFSTEHAARHRGGLPATASYALAAVLAMTIDFPLDVAVKKTMAAPASEPAPRGGAVRLALRLLREKRLAVFAGIGYKACEFAVSYACTGWVSTLIS